MQSILRYDLSFLMRDKVGAAGLDLSEFRDLAPACARAVENVEALHRSGEVGFPDLPEAHGAAEAVERVAARVRTEFEDFVLIGIGGSGLGPAALFSALAHPQHNLLPREERGAPRFHIVDNIDPDALHGLLESLDPRATAVNVITKSGATPESLASFLIVAEWLERALGAGALKERIFATTDPRKGDLRALADAEGWTSFAIPPNVGGRFSVLSPVGLFPAAVLGLDVRGLLAGARNVARECRSADPFENPALLGAAAHFLADTRRDLHTQVFMAYSEKLARTADWFQQLWAESLGKRVRRDGREEPAGQLPVSARGATDQHSVMQLFMEGPVDRVVTFLSVERFDHEMPIPVRYERYDSFSYLGGHSVAELMAAECRAAQIALAQAGRPNLALRMGRVDARHLGGLFYLLELQTAYAGELYDVNAFDQPGVESGKRYAAGLLGRPGYESYAERINRLGSGEGPTCAVAPNADEREWLHELERNGALLRGHFELRSGLHSDLYFQCALALSHPELAERLGAAIAEPFRAAGVDCVVSPALGGIVVGHEAARALGVRSVFTEKDEKGRLQLRRFSLRPGERVLIVEDVITRGGRVGETIDVVRAAGGEPVAVAVILDRSGGKAGFDLPLHRLLRVEAAVYAPESCPLCREGIPLSKPGSR